MPVVRAGLGELVEEIRRRVLRAKRVMPVSWAEVREWEGLPDRERRGKGYDSWKVYVLDACVFLWGEGEQDVYLARVILDRWPEGLELAALAGLADCDPPGADSQAHI